MLVDSNLTGKFLTDIPQHKLSGSFKYLNKIVNSSFLIKYNGSSWINEYNTIENEYFFTNKFPGYLICNIRFEKTIFKRYNIAFNVENVFDKKYIDSRLQQSPGRMMFVSAGIKF